MKTRITDLVQDCYAENINIGEYDEELSARIMDNVQNRLGVKNTPPRRVRKLPRAFLLAAVLVLAFGAVAFAIAEYTLSLRKPSADEELVSGFRYEEVVDGKVWNSEILAYPDAGMIFTFNCPEEITSTPEFRCFWLPQEATEGITDEQGWTKRLHRMSRAFSAEMIFFSRCSNQPNVLQLKTYHSKHMIRDSYISKNSIRAMSHFLQTISLQRIALSNIRLCKLSYAF